MAHTIQKRGFNLKPVTYCYNLIEEKAWFIPGFLRILQQMMKENLKEKENLMNVPQFIQSNKHIMDGVLDKQGLCNECGTHTAVVNYNDGNYCNWYCAKKSN